MKEPRRFESVDGHPPPRAPARWLALLAVGNVVTNMARSATGQTNVLVGTRPLRAEVSGRGNRTPRLSQNRTW